MDFNEYQKLAMITAGEVPDDEKLLFGSLCLAGEAGEIANMIKKVKWHGHELDSFKLVDELGDCLWYINHIADTIGVPLEWIATHNIAKLKRRYPQGFSEQDSINRQE